MTLYTGNMTESDKMYQATGYDMYKPDSLMAFGASFEKGMRMGPGMISFRKQEREGPFLQEKETAVTGQVEGFESEFLKLARRPGMGFTEAPRDEYAPMPEDVWKDSVDYREDLKWDESFTPRKAQYIAEAKDEENRLNDILDRSKHGVVEFTGEMAGGMLDPFNVAAMFVPVVKGAQTAAWIGKYGKVGGRALTGAIEGVVGASLIEPIVLGNASQEQMDYNAYDSLMNVSAGLILGSALHTGLGFAGDVLGKAKAKTKKTALDTTVGQLADGRQADISPIIETEPGLTGQPRMSEKRYQAELKKTQVKLKKVESDILIKRGELGEVSGADLAEYQAAVSKSQSIAESKIKDIYKAEDKAAMRSIKKQAIDEVNNSPIYTDMSEAIQGGGIDLETARMLSDDVTVNELMKRRPGLFKKGSKNKADLFANEKGFDTADEMFQDWLNYGTKKDAIVRTTDELFREYEIGSEKGRALEFEQILADEQAKGFSESIGKGPKRKTLSDLEALKANLEQESKMSYDEYIDRLGTDPERLPKTKTETIDSILDESGELKPRKRAWEDQEQVDAVNSEEPEKIMAPDEEVVKLTEETTVIENDLINRIQNGQVLEDESLEAAMSVINEAKIDAEKKSQFVDNIVECFLANGMSLV